MGGDLDELNAKKRLGVIDASIEFASRAEFRRYISDVADEYPSSARNPTPPTRSLEDHIRCAAGAETIECLLKTNESDK